MPGKPDVRITRVLFGPRGRGTVVGLAALVGIAVGAILYGCSHLHGIGLYLLVGAVVGAVVGLLVSGYYGNVALDEVKVTFPQFSELTFKVTPDNRLVAWRFYIETTTRVATQALEADTGKLREAITSLYNLFQAVRGNLNEARPSRPGAPGPKVEELAIAMLNNELRPFLSKWHPELEEWEKKHPDEPERNWEANAACRADLAVLQRRLGRYADGFAKLAGLEPGTPPAPELS